MKKYIVFTDLPVIPGRKTKRVLVSSTLDVALGVISFWSAWRQFTFQPYEETVFDVKCLKEIIEEVERMNNEIRNEWKTRYKKSN